MQVRGAMSCESKTVMYTSSQLSMNVLMMWGMRLLLLHIAKQDGERVAGGGR